MSTTESFVPPPNTPPPNVPPAGGNSGIATLHGGISDGGIGVNHGTVYQYHVRPDASPQERARMAGRCLGAGLRERAERLFEEAVAGGLDTAEVRYGRLLAVVSRRSPEELSDADWQRSRDLFPAPGVAPSPDPDGYGAAARAVAWLLTAVLDPELSVRDPESGEVPAEAGTGAVGGLPPEPGTDVTAILADLPLARREEIEDHLRHMIEVLRRRLSDADEARALEEARLADRRAERVPYFFTADPLPPRAPDPAAVPRWLPNARVGLAVTGVALLLGLVVGVVGLASSDSGGGSGSTGFDSGFGSDSGFDSSSSSSSEGEAGVGVVVGLLVGVGLAGGLFALAHHRTAPRRLHERRLRLWMPPAGPRPNGSGGLADRLLRRRAGTSAEARAEASARRREAFRSTVADLVDARYSALAPHDAAAAAHRMAATADRRTELTAELTHHHWRTGDAAGLDWLIQRRAAEDARRPLPAPRPTDPTGTSDGFRWARVIGGITAGLCLLVLIGLAMGTGVLWVTVIAWGIALYTGPETARVAALVRIHEEERKRWEEDSRWQRSWADTLLRNRPDDVRMARWLEVDKQRLRRAMLAEHRMENRDIIFDFFVLEAAPDCVRARVPGGPVRYSESVLKLFVLTGKGVWVSTWRVDSATGGHTGRNDVVFRYDAIGSAMLDTGPAGTEEGATGRVPREALRLVLHNRQDVRVEMEDYALLGETGEGTESLRDLAREVSGAADGFRMLAALTTEGKEWFDHRRRQAHRALHGRRDREGGRTSGV
ncbi:hypothetical protein GCM10027160_50090 [Streptomyces calidiresistens]|uniref:Uncharacterized protein n=1 Tax=Streptomyces calidiresistens TaxID=1485586 RepID=A0A7W3XXY3_9ACTN|nr:hypothetical protein [Streptomyces calidiresistens]MBB0231560.1 hypothetical protein [Streptomyces calidiresistens]